MKKLLFIISLMLACLSVSAQTGTIEARVWNDTNNDGKQNGSESGENVSGVAVSLLDNNGVVASTQTAANGIATFNGINPGTYRLLFKAPTDHKFAKKTGGILDGNNSDADVSGNTKGRTGTFTVAADATVSVIDAGLIAPGTVQARVWNDTNNDGKQNGGESGNNIAGVTVELLEANGNFISSTVTNGSGIATINNVPADRDVRLRFTALPDHKFAKKTGTITDGNNSDADVSGNTKGRTGTFRINAGSETITYVDAGLIAPGSVVARVWNDTNNDGKQNGSESGSNIEGVTVELLEANGNPILDGGTPITGTTDANGLATISPVPADRNVRLRFTALPDHKFAKKTGSITDGNNSDADVSGNTKGRTGTFSIQNGSETITYVDAGLIAPGSVVARVWNDTNNDGKQNGSESGDNIAGVTVELLESNGNPILDDNNQPITGTTNGSGLATIAPVPADRSVRLRFTALPDHKFAKKTGSITDGNNSDADVSGNTKGRTGTFSITKGSETITYVDAGLIAPGSVVARVWNDRNGDGKQNGSENGDNIAGVTVELLESNGIPVLDNNNQPITAVTNGDGLATIAPVPADRPVRLRFNALTDHRFTGKSGSIGDGNNSDADVSGNTKGRTGTFSITKGSEVITYVDAGLWAPGIVRTRIWMDRNGDKKQNGSENAPNDNVFGFLVRVLEANGSPLLRNGQPVTALSDCGTGEASLYIPADRPVRLKYELFNGATFTAKSGSIGDGNNSDADVSGNTKGRTGTFQVTKGSDVITYVDAGLTDRGNWWDAQVSPFVWDDRDGDGRQDSGEPGVAGVKAFLLDRNTGATCICEKTDADGEVSLKAISAYGQYRLQIERPGDHAFTQKDKGGVPEDKDSDVRTDNGQTGNFSLSPGQNRTNLDAGLWTPGSVETFVWDDRDGDGRQDSGEPGIANVPVALLENNGTPVMEPGVGPVTAMTDANGIAVLTYVPADRKVKLDYDLLADHAFTLKDKGGVPDDKDSDPRTDNGITGTFQANRGNQKFTKWDAGMWTPGSVETFVWDDRDGDGRQDSGEPGVGGVLVKLLENNGNPVMEPGVGPVTATTDPITGLATLSYVPADRKVKLEYDLLADHAFTLKDKGGVPDDKDSDPRTDNGITGTFQANRGNQKFTKWDAGMWTPGSVETFVWDDRDGDGRQDSGEPGVKDVPVALLENNGDPVIDPNTSQAVTAMTGANGIAVLSYVPANRKVKLDYDLLADHAFTLKDKGGVPDDKDSDPRTDNGITGTFQANRGNQTFTKWDAGLWTPGSVETFVWDDRDGDGRQDSGEPGVKDVPVALLENNGDPVIDPNTNQAVTAMTGANGIAVLSYVPANRKVKLDYDLLADHAFTLKDKGGVPDDKDSDPRTDNGITGTFQANRGNQTFTKWDAGLWTPGSVKAYVWEDSDRDGRQDSGEMGIYGMRVNLLENNGSPVLRPNGTEVFALTECGSFEATLDYVPADRKVKLEFIPFAGGVFTQKDRGGVPDDKDSDPRTDNGITGTFQANRGNQTFTKWDAGFTDRGNWSDATIQSFVWDDTDANGLQSNSERNNNGIENVKVRLTDNSGNTCFCDRTNAAGRVDLPAIAGYTDRYRLRFDLPADHRFTNKSGSLTSGSNSDANTGNGQTDRFSISAGETITYIDAGLWAPGTLEAFVWDDTDANGQQSNSERNNNGIGGVKVDLTETNGTVIATTNTNASGKATFQDVPADRQLRLKFHLPADHAFTGKSGSITNGSNSDANTGNGVTDKFQASRGSDNITYVDAGLWAPGTVEAFVWDDTDANGQQSNSERNNNGIEGVAVDLTETNGTVIASTTTDENGKANFTNVPANRELRLKFHLPADHAFTGKSGNITNGSNSDANTGSGVTDKFRASRGSDNITYVDAGLWAPGTLEAFVWDDRDANGQQSNSERNNNGIGGVKVDLTETNGTVLATTMTNANGKANFSNVPANRELRLKFHLPADHAFTGKSGSITNGSNSDANTGNGVTDKFRASRGSDNITYVDAGLWAPGTLEAFVWDDRDANGTQSNSERNNNGIENVRVDLTETNGTVLATTMTNAAGKANFSDVPSNRELRLKFFLPNGYSFTAKSGNITNGSNSDANTGNGVTDKFRAASGSENITYVDAGMFAPATVRAFVWADDGNGTQSNSERNNNGIGGVTVHLTGSNSGDILDTKMTDVKGSVRFDDVPTDRELRLKFELPGGYSFTTKSGNITEQNNSDANTGNGVTDKFQANSGSQVIDYVDAGMIAPVAPITAPTIAEEALETTTAPDLNLEMDITLYPNPSTDVVNLVFDAVADDDAAYIVFDQSGRLVMEQRLRVFQGNNQLEIRVDELPSGTYHLQLRAGKQVSRKAFQVIR